MQCNREEAEVEFVMKPMSRYESMSADMCQSKMMSRSSSYRQVYSYTANFVNSALVQTSAKSLTGDS